MASVPPRHRPRPTSPAHRRPRPPGASASETASAAPSEEPAPSFPPETGALQFASWLGYIDIDEATNTYPTIQKFTKETGIEVNYVEAVDGNEEFFTSNLKGPLDAGLPTAWDIVVLTDWMIDRLVRLGWLEPFVRSAMPNFVANLIPLYVGRSFDPDTKFAAPVAVRDDRSRASTRTRPATQTSLKVFFTDQFAKKMTYLTEMRDTVGLSALVQGDRSGDDHRATVPGGDWPRSTPPSRRAGSARSRATRTSTSWPGATRSSRWPGRATS